MVLLSCSCSIVDSYSTWFTSYIYLVNSSLQRNTKSRTLHKFLAFTHYNIILYPTLTCRKLATHYTHLNTQIVRLFQFWGVLWIFKELPVPVFKYCRIKELPVQVLGKKTQNQRTIGHSYLKNPQRITGFHERTSKELMVLSPALWFFKESWLYTNTDIHLGWIISGYLSLISKTAQHWLFSSIY